MINKFLIISCTGKDDKLGLRINKEFFTHIIESNINKNEKLVSEILSFLTNHKIILDENFSVIVNQGPGSFSSIRVALAVAKGLEIAKKVKIFGYKNYNLDVFKQENIEKLLKKKIVEKNLIKPIYLS